MLELICEDKIIISYRYYSILYYFIEIDKVTLKFKV